jgi:hypothetical protein
VNNLSRLLLSCEEQREVKRRNDYREARASARRQAAATESRAVRVPSGAPLADAEMATVRGTTPDSADDEIRHNEPALSIVPESTAVNSTDAPRSPASNASSDEDTCRICREGDEEEELIAPCRCTGSLKYIHRSCLQKWRFEAIARNPRYITHCEVCQTPLNPEVVPTNRGPPLARIVVDKGVRFALYVIVAIALVLLIGFFTAQTAGRASCREAWHDVDGTFFMVFADGCCAAMALSILVQFTAHATLVQASQRVMNEGRIPHPPPARELALSCAVRTFGILTHAAIAGILFNYLLTATSDRVPHTIELRLGNGLVLVGLLSLAAWGITRLVSPRTNGDEAVQTRQRANLNAALLGPTGTAEEAAAGDAAGATGTSPEVRQPIVAGEAREAALLPPPGAARVAADTSANRPTADLLGNEVHENALPRTAFPSPPHDPSHAA